MLAALPVVLALVRPGTTRAGRQIDHPPPPALPAPGSAQPVPVPVPVVSMLTFSPLPAPTLTP